MLFSELIYYAKKADLSFSYNFDTLLLSSHDVRFTHACMDNRKAEKNSLFICIKGENNDGHNFAEDAIKRGAVALIAEKSEEERIRELNIPTLFVENSAKALEKIAKEIRLDFQGKVIAITGTAGKTSVKEMLWQVLSQKGKTAKNYLNYNTQLGVSLTILSAEQDEDFWVLEAGISHEHDMEEIAHIINPDIALVLNAGLGHAEGLPKGAAYYKSKLFKYLKNDTSIALASSDYPELLEESKKNFENTLYFSTQDNAQPYFAEYKGINENEKGIFEVKIPFAKKDEIFEIYAPLRSAYGAENVIAISAIASLCGMGKEEIQKAFENTSLPVQRFEVYTYKDITLIDDSYNANPLSFVRMLEAARDYAIKNKAPLLCLAGAMYELGEISENEHFKLGEELAKHDVEKVFYIGAFEKEVEKGFHSLKNMHEFSLLSQPENFFITLESLALEKAVFLVKGSRSNHLEEYVKEIKKLYDKNHCE